LVPVLADGFYEWPRPFGGTGPKVPHAIQMADGRPFGFAGLWESWRGGDGEDELFSCTILTTGPNRVLRS
jgi:putative SOS response-associated peptidase YedK